MVDEPLLGNPGNNYVFNRSHPSHSRMRIAPIQKAFLHSIAQVCGTMQTPT